MDIQLNKRHNIRHFLASLWLSQFNFNFYLWSTVYSTLFKCMKSMKFVLPLRNLRLDLYLLPYANCRPIHNFLRSQD